MKYKVIKPMQMDETILSKVLSNRKIGDLKSYIDTPKKYSLPYNTLNNINRVLEVIEEVFECGYKIGLLVDCDVDGYTSASIIYQYLKALNPIVEIELFFHTGKQHGLSAEIIDDIKKSTVEVLLIPDAGSGDDKELEAVKNTGKTIIVMDHHEVEEESQHAIIVNNQLSDYENKQLSGAGVVYRVCQGLDDLFGVKLADRFLDLVALGNIADGMNMSNLDVRYLAQQGLNEINNTLMKCIIQKQSFAMQNKVNIMTVGWNVAPMLNAVIRVGSQDDKEMLFMGFVSDDEEFCMTVVNMCLKVQRQQNASVKKVVPTLINKVYESGLDKNKVIIVDATGLISNNIIGLVANKLLSEFKRPVMLLHEREEDKGEITGSVRCPREVYQFKTMCARTGEFIFCEGHQNAFGCALPKENVDRVTEKLNSLLSSVSIDAEPTFSVDAVVQFGHLMANDVYAIGELADLWGNGIAEPMFVIKGIKVNSNDIRLAGKNNTIMFNKGEFSFVKFFTNHATWLTMTMNEEEEDFDAGHALVMDIVCKFKVNEWMGRTKPQLEIIDFVVKTDELDFF